jgi:hypothetical protein
VIESYDCVKSRQLLHSLPIHRNPNPWLLTWPHDALIQGMAWNGGSGLLGSHRILQESALPFHIGEGTGEMNMKRRKYVRRMVAIPQQEIQTRRSLQRILQRSESLRQPHSEEIPAD